MFKFSAIFLIFYLKTVIPADTSWCSTDTFVKEKCLCNTFTNENTNFPASMANCAGLSINKFPSFLDLPDDINVLDLSMNNIEILESSSESSSHTLKQLVLSYNIIKDISEDFFNGLPGLTWLDLSHNNLSSLYGSSDSNIFLQQKNLIYLDLSFNNFKQLPGGVFYPLAMLKSLDLSYNPLGEFLSQSKDILYRTLGTSLNLTRLSLNNLQLNDLHPDYFTSYQDLKELELQDNYFNYIPTVPYSVEFLDLSGNNISFIAARYLNYHSLKSLRLSRMPSLTSIHHYAFYNLQSLESLTITDCPNLKEFTELAFGLASKVMDIHPIKLNLARNSITTLNSTYVHMFRQMKQVDLRHNPWQCDCNILWLQEFGTELFKSREIRCASPKNLANKRVLDLTEADWTECYPHIYGKTSHKITIVVLMGAVIFLTGLIFYLIKYPKFWVSPQDLGINIGPNSPYSEAPQEDNRIG
ncbi:hypothetical protein ABEB36_012606 [Hypothenemus hampei]|uniref:LRRCT domain-containing protein n=1 Tax=Hypothenemus hampei TaxID=57062 RepID=A0ABD1EG41_HYPHA